jgi:hypothetical protein
MTGAVDHLIRIAIVVCICTVVGMTYGAAVKTLIAGVLPS